jgi:hypothetical protein
MPLSFSGVGITVTHIHISSLEWNLFVRAGTDVSAADDVSRTNYHNMKNLSCISIVRLEGRLFTWPVSETASQCVSFFFVEEQI